MAAVILPPCLGVPASVAPPDAAPADAAPADAAPADAAPPDAAAPDGTLVAGVDPQAATTMRIVASKAAGRPPRRRKVCIGEAPRVTAGRGWTRRRNRDSTRPAGSERQSRTYS